MTSFPDYTPSDWYWIVGGDASRFWSSAAGAYVEPVDTDKLTRIASEQELAEVLAIYGLTGPVSVVPESVLMWKARSVLASHSLLSLAEELISGSGNAAYVAAWEYAPEISRDSPLVNWAAAGLGLTSEQVDAMFVEAAAIAV